MQRTEAAKTLDLIDDDEGTKFFQAIAENNSTRLTELISHGCDIFVQKDGKYGWEIAAELNHWSSLLPIVKELLKTKSEKDYPSLGMVMILAVKAKQEDILELLRTARPWHGLFFKSVNWGWSGATSYKSWRDPLNGYTSLHWAVINRNITFIQQAFTRPTYHEPYHQVAMRAFSTQDHNGLTFLDLAFSLNDKKFLAKVLDLALKNSEGYFSRYLKHSPIENLFVTMFKYKITLNTKESGKRQKELLNYILLLAPEQKLPALQAAINPKKPLGAYLAGEKNDKKFKKIMVEELTKLTVMPFEDEENESLLDITVEESLELKPIYPAAKNVPTLFPSVPTSKGKGKEKEKEIIKPKTLVNA